MSDTDDYRRRWNEAQDEARLRQDEHTRTMVVMLEKQVDALYRRCQECWQQFEEQKAVIGGMLETVDEIQKARTVQRDWLAGKFAEINKRLDELEG